MNEHRHLPAAQTNSKFNNCNLLLFPFSSTFAFSFALVSSKMAETADGKKEKEVEGGTREVVCSSASVRSFKIWCNFLSSNIPFGSRNDLRRLQ